MYSRFRGGIYDSGVLGVRVIRSRYEMMYYTMGTSLRDIYTSRTLILTIVFVSVSHASKEVKISSSPYIHLQKRLS
jgi:hypothetical protein